MSLPVHLLTVKLLSWCRIMSTLKIITVADAREFEAIKVQGVFNIADPGDEMGKGVMHAIGVV